MAETIEVDFTTVMYDNKTGLPVLNPSEEDVKKYATIKGDQISIKTNDIPNITKYTLVDALIELFDKVNFSKSTAFSNYDGILHQITKAKKDQKTTISLLLDEKQTLQNTLIDPPPNDPTLNTKISFILQCLNKH